MGASLLVFLNKTDVEQCMNEQEVREVCTTVLQFTKSSNTNGCASGLTWIQSKPTNGQSCRAVP